jgi:hypothetical protein
MNVIVVVLLGLGAGAAFGILAALAALTRVPLQKARRAGLAGAIGGTIAFTLTALAQLPFFANGSITVPLVMAGVAGALAAGGAASLILRVKLPEPSQAAPHDAGEDI